MVTRIGTVLRGVRQFFSRTEWAIRLLRLEKHEASDAPGLVMVQVDGLSLKQFHRAMEKGHLPFLKHLLKKERYVLHSHYSGLPSNTPGVQGELFYGVKACVPAFNFLDRPTGRILRMYDSPAAVEIEARLQAENEGLLKGGSAYADIFTGGADEAHFCAAKLGWRGLFHAANPLIFPFFLILYADVFARVLTLLMLEAFLALYDCAKATLKGDPFLPEFGFIPSRVLVCVLLRELTVMGACMDVARGMPVIHLNLIGYDEQAHRRGPSSAFAHWSLEGIDDSIQRVWSAMGKFSKRHYDLWIYSDHGQEKVLSYVAEHGRTVQQAVEKLFGETVGPRPEPQKPAAAWRVKLLKEGVAEKAMKTGKPQEKHPVTPITVTAMGPVGHIYLNYPMDRERKRKFAQLLVQEARIPLVLTQEESGPVAWTEEGPCPVPQEMHRLVETTHPFFQEIGEDLAKISSHPNAGEFVILGWRKGQVARSFPVENGAHAGLGEEETSGFAFLPADAPLRQSEKKYLRPLDLRAAALHFLGKQTPIEVVMEDEKQALFPSAFSVMTYNVHGCVGMDGRLSPDRIARVIARHDVDVVALQELDVGRARSGGVDQAEKIARKLEMNFHFHPTHRLKDEQFGNAILSRYPMCLMKSEALPRLKARADYEPRGALWVSFEASGWKVNLINTHLSLWPNERMLQVNALLGHEWLGHPECRGPAIVCGDFNAAPGSYVCRRLSEWLRDSQKVLAEHRPHKTWMGRYPVSRIDHVFISRDFDVAVITVPVTTLDRISSDHLALIVELQIQPQEALLRR